MVSMTFKQSYHRIIFLVTGLIVSGAIYVTRTNAESLPDITYQAGKVSLSAPATSNIKLLRRLSDEADMEVILIGQPTEIIQDWFFIQTPLRQVITSLAFPNGLALVMSTKQETIDKALIVGKGNSTAIEAEDAETIATSSEYLSTPTEEYKENHAPTKPFVKEQKSHLIFDEHPTTRQYAIRHLASTGNVNLIADALGDPDPNVRLIVIESLMHITPEVAQPLLGQILFSDPEPRVRIAAVKLISSYPDTEASRAFLNQAAKDISAEVRNIAKEALQY